MLPELDQVCIRIYAALVRAPHTTKDALRAQTGLPAKVLEKHLADLRGLRLAVRSAGRWSAADPSVAARLVLDPVEERLHAEHWAAETALRRVGELRYGLTELGPIYSEGRRSSQAGGVEILVGADVAGTAIIAAALEAKTEMLTMRPSTAEPGARLSQDVIQRDLTVAKGGVRLRGLYAHTARPDLELRSHIDRLTKLGGEVRTMAQPFAHIVVFDETVAYLMDEGGTGSGGRPDTYTIVMRDPTVIRYLRNLFEMAWRVGTPVQAEERGYGDAIADVHRTVAELLAEGLKDETAARRMGVSVRSFRRHVAALSNALRAESRFQAGVAAARAGMLRNVPR